MRIAVDIMGADHEPSILLDGMRLALLEKPGMKLHAVGDKKLIEEFLSKHKTNIQIQAAEQVVVPNDIPICVVRTKRKSSMVAACKMVLDGEADAMISAGNTGALVCTGLYYLKELEGVKKPALAPMIPTIDNVGVLALDLGATTDPNPDDLIQYGVMGSIFREKIHGIKQPRVGLLNIGTEKDKGDTLRKDTNELLTDRLLTDPPFNFIGNVEARDVLQRNCDVLVCDGFVGNVLLKAMEGTASTLLQVIKDELSSSFWTRLLAAPMRNRLRAIRDKYNYKSTGAAILLGVNGLLFKAHGSSDAYAIKNAILQAARAIETDMLNNIRSELSKLPVREDGK